jgi:polar amino acid transport system substrate-binding protein
MKTINLLAACCLVWLGCAQAETLLVVDDWPPYVDFAKANQGALTALVQQAFRHAGVPVRLEHVAWKKAEYMVDAGKAASYGWIKTPERQHKWQFSEPICSQRTVLVSRASKPVLWQSPSDLLPYRIGWTRGYSYGAEFEQWKSKLQVAEVSNDLAGLKVLLLGRIDALPLDTLEARVLAEQLAPADRGRLQLEPPKNARAVASGDIFLVCNKSQPECAQTLAVFNRELKQLHGGKAVDCGQLLFSDMQGHQ